MTQAIIYQNDAGGVAIVIPSPNTALTIHELAAKDVPTGKPYAIVDASEIPTDRTARNEWTVDVADLTDGVGA